MSEWFAPRLLIRRTCEGPNLTFESRLQFFSLLLIKCFLPHCPHYHVSVQYRVVSAVDEVSSDTSRIQKYTSSKM
jgi:hypothetical protein